MGRRKLPLRAPIAAGSKRARQMVAEALGNVSKNRTKKVGCQKHIPRRSAPKVLKSRGVMQQAYDQIQSKNPDQSVPKRPLVEKPVNYSWDNGGEGLFGHGRRYSEPSTQQGVVLSPDGHFMSCSQ